MLLLADKPGDPLLGRIKAEIASLGLDVVERVPQGPIETSARAERAVAAIRRLPSRNGVEVWMADETSGRSLLRQAIVDETPGGPDQNLIALQTAELLRTSLFPHLPLEEARPVAAAPAPAIIQIAPSRPSGESGVAASIGLLFTGGGAGPAWQAWLSYQRLWSRFGLALVLGAPVQRGTMTGREGTAEVGAIIAGAEVIARFTSARPRLFMTTGLGAAFASVLATGHPSQDTSPQLLSESSAVYTGLGYARVTLGWKLSSWLALGVSGLAGTTVARVHVRFAGSDTGSFGVPLLGAALHGEIDWD